MEIFSFLFVNYISDRHKAFFIELLNFLHQKCNQSIKEFTFDLLLSDRFRFENQWWNVERIIFMVSTKCDDWKHKQKQRFVTIFNQFANFDNNFLDCVIFHLL